MEEVLLSCFCTKDGYAVLTPMTGSMQQSYRTFFHYAERSAKRRKSEVKLARSHSLFHLRPMCLMHYDLQILMTRETVLCLSLILKITYTYTLSEVLIVK